MALTQITLVATCKSLSTRRDVSGNTYTIAHCKVAPSTGTVKTSLNGEYVDPSGIFVQTATFELAYKSGAGTAPAVGETFNVVLG